MSLAGLYHTGYVTHDLDKALDLFAQRLGITGLVAAERSFLVRTPGGEFTSVAKVALGPGIEVVQPVSGYQDQIAPFLPRDCTDPSPRVNHVAMRRTDLEAMRREIRALGAPVAFEIETDEVSMVYVDPRPEIGHYLEYVCASPAFWERLGR